MSVTPKLRNPGLGLEQGLVPPFCTFSLNPGLDPGDPEMTPCQILVLRSPFERGAGRRLLLEEQTRDVEEGGGRVSRVLLGPGFHPLASAELNF